MISVEVNVCVGSRKAALQLANAGVCETGSAFEILALACVTYYFHQLLRQLANGIGLREGSFAYRLKVSGAPEDFCRGYVAFTFGYVYSHLLSLYNTAPLLCLTRSLEKRD